jgi:hypothetical protein
MGKFKVGDRVRFAMDYGHAKKGDEGTIVSFWAEDGAVVTHKTVNHSCNFSRIELVPSVAAWHPKVGDRVRFVCDSNAGGERYGAKGEYATAASEVHISEDGRHYLSVKLDDNRCGFPPSAYLADIEPIQAPTTLAISSGKFYKTRDGRKVGPVVVAQGQSGYWPWKLASGTHYYRNDGHSCPGWAYGHSDADDLIAEWVDDFAYEPGPWSDEPAVAAIANDNAAPAKFKVGDRVKFRPGYPSSVAGREATVVAIDAFGVQVDLGVRGGVSTESESDLVPANVPAIVALIEDGIAKPATKPRVHSSQGGATAEAERLALLYPGQEFGVFVLAGSKIADVVEEVVKKTVLRAA